MGAYLSEPDTTKFTEFNKHTNFNYATCLAQGWKIIKDNYLLVSPYFDDDNSLFAIFECEGCINLFIDESCYPSRIYEK